MIVINIRIPMIFVEKLREITIRKLVLQISHKSLEIPISNDTKLIIQMKIAYSLQVRHKLYHFPLDVFKKKRTKNKFTINIFVIKARRLIINMKTNFAP